MLLKYKKRVRSLRYLPKIGKIYVGQDTVFACSDIVLFQYGSQVINDPFYDVFLLLGIKHPRL